MSQITVDIDIGGTLTDGLFTTGHRVEAVKVDTTPHDPTVCFLDCLTAGSQRLGFTELPAFLAQVAVMRWSSTIATNVIAERRGPRVGLLVDEGYKDSLYGSGPSAAIGILVDSQYIETLTRPLQANQVLEAVRRLLARGVRRICVSLCGAHQEPGMERAVKRIIGDQFPDHFVGAVPVLAGSDVLDHPDDQTRTHVALINSYVHTPLALSLFKAEDELLKHRYRRPLYIGHINGGVARVAKTKAIETVESGPIFGLFASAYFARRYKLGCVLSLDVGGTTCKFGLIRDGEPDLVESTDIFGIPLQIPAWQLRSIALGGGSVARARDGQVALGPDSMGAYPGPACYNVGGTRPTVTDAFLVAEALNPTRFLGGARRLSVARAREALAADVAEPLRVEVSEAAQLVVRRTVAMVADAGKAVLAAAGDTHRSTPVLFAFGGNGALVAADVAAELRLPRAYVFRMGPVFSAFGSSIARIRHMREAWPQVRLPEGSPEVAKLLTAAWRAVEQDLAAEGQRLEDASFAIELVMKTGAGREVHREVLARAEGIPGAVAAVASRYPVGVVEIARALGVLPVPHYEPGELPTSHHEPLPMGARNLAWGGQVGKAAVFDWDALEGGAAISGPAILEGAANTCVVPPGWNVAVDGFGNAVLEPARR